MTGIDGKLIPNYRVHCADCREPALGLGKTQGEAQQTLKRMGWSHFNLWRCPTCAAKIDRMMAPIRRELSQHP